MNSSFDPHLSFDSEPEGFRQISSTRKLIYWLISVVFSLCLIIAVTEIGAHFVLKSQGIDSPLFFRSAQETILGRDQFREAYRTLDPHLAFTYGKNSEKLQEVKKTRVWVDGFLFHSPMQQGARKAGDPGVGGLNH